MTLQAVFFDMGGTIETFCHDRKLRLQATGGLRQILLRAGIDLDLDTEQLYTLVTKGLARYHRWRKQTLIELPPERIWRVHILADHPTASQKLDAVAAEELTFYIETKYYRREMRPEMPQALAAVQKLGLKMGVISNVQSRGQVPANLEQYGLIHFFDPIVLTSVYGWRKPDPSIFHHAARLAGVPAGACAHVGDRVSRDILGARRAGYRLAVQIRHGFPPGYKDTGAAPDAVLDDMTELVDILEAELRRPARSSHKPRGVRAVLFDAGDILYFRPHKGQRLNAFLAELGLDPANTPLEEKLALKTRAFRGEIDRDGYRKELLKLHGVRGKEQIERGKRVMEQETNAIQFFDGVKETLTTLKERGLLLGVVTDTVHSVSVKLAWFEQAGIGHLWDTFISSCELGMRKPEPGMYCAALDQLGVRPDETLFVGHKISELDGARAVGIKTIAFNYEDNAQADVYVEHFSDLVQAVSKLSNLKR